MAVVCFICYCCYCNKHTSKKNNVIDIVLSINVDIPTSQKCTTCKCISLLGMVDIFKTSQMQMDGDCLGLYSVTTDIYTSSMPVYRRVFCGREMKCGGVLGR